LEKLVTESRGTKRVFGPEGGKGKKKLINGREGEEKTFGKQTFRGK